MNQARAEIERLERVAQFLWKLLDDIDTLDDSCREDDQSFRKAVYRAQQKRWTTGAKSDGYIVDLSKADTIT